MDIVKVLDLGNDVLEVTGVDDDGNEVVATGWVSAMTNHYPTVNGKRADSPRAMTEPERRAYWLSLLGGTVEAAPEPIVLFEA